MINIQDIKNYNKELEACRKRANDIQVERSYIEKDIAALCEELSEELGTEVTVDNAEELCADYERRIENTIASGREIFSRVKAEGEYAGGLAE